MSTKYKMVVEELEKEIVEGLYNENKKLPTEDELMRKFEVSRNTIRKAVEILVSQGYVYQVQGSGIFIREFQKPGCITLSTMSGLTKTFPQDILKSELLELKVIEATEWLIKKMKCSSDTKIYYVKRLRYVNDEPFVIEESYFSKDIIPYLNEDICNESIYRYIMEDLKLKIGFADKIISCDRLNQEDAALLGINENDPTLIIENTVYLNTGMVFDVSREKYLYSKAKLLSLSTLS